MTLTLWEGCTLALDTTGAPAYVLLTADRQPGRAETERVRAQISLQTRFAVTLGKWRATDYTGWRAEVATKIAARR